LGLKGIRPLARSGNLSQLRRLDLGDNHLDNRCARILAASKTLPRSPLFVLHVGARNRIGAPGAQALKERFGQGVR
jgi:hypothetical protein